MGAPESVATQAGGRHDGGLVAAAGMVPRQGLTLSHMVCAEARRMARGRRLVVVASILMVVMDWVPGAFLVGGLLAMYNWDAARESKAGDPTWYRLWLIGLALSVTGMVYTIWLLPHLATI